MRRTWPPDDFLKCRQRLLRQGLTGWKGLGVYALTRAFTVVRSMLKYAHAMCIKGNAGGIKKVVNVDTIGDRFGIFLRKLSLKRRGIGFYILRYTFRIWTDEVRDQHAIHHIMGHSIPGMWRTDPPWNAWCSGLDLPALRRRVHLAPQPEPSTPPREEDACGPPALSA